MIRMIPRVWGRKLAILAVGACLAIATTPLQAMPIHIAPMDEGARPLVESVRYKPRPRRAVRHGGGNGGAALMLGAVALGVGAIVASQQRSREERRARRHYEQQYYPAQQYYDPGYAREPVYQRYPAYQEQYAPSPPVYRAPRRVYQPAPVYYAPPRERHVRVLRPHGGQTARRERHEARQRYWSR